MTTFKTRFFYLITLVAIIFLGLLSRKISTIPLWIGDSLWAVAVYLGFRLFFTKIKPEATALISLGVSFIVEFSQLVNWAPLDTIRTTTLGHLFLGQGFLISDLIAYILGVFLIFSLDKMAHRKGIKDF
ncbi:MULTISPECIES: ribosomal maturation YjgA family protein [Streptococcus]|uniref:DUF2809 domain-containing protein n=1 Tax=Streptococcus caledonicus TaxID=2614158 RepID=A0ABW0UCY8_9STRE|nr:DUF2809 domain-containing protein [Streptococcus sp. S784/96/1]